MASRPSMLVRRFLISTHRWLGIPMSLLFVVWFVSGIVMMYAGGMPQLGAETRLERLAPLDLGAIRLSAAEAAGRMGDFVRDPGRTTLLTVMGRPAYRFGGGAGATTVFADTGEVLAPLDPAQSQAIARQFIDAAEPSVHYVGTLTAVDQWTLTHRGDLPLHQFRVDDGEGTELYVSAERAEVVLATTSRSRTLAWLGTIPHWFYFTPLRTNQPLWYWSVVWASALGCVLAVLGLALGITQFRRSKPFRLSASIRYQGWMRWHYLLGVVFGLFALTWVFSGLLSMEPFEWTNAQGLSVRRNALSGGPLELARFERIDRQAWSNLLGDDSLKELEFLRIQDEPYYLARTAGPAHGELARRERLHQPYIVSGGRRVVGERLVAADTMAVRDDLFDTQEILNRLSAELPPDIRAVEHELLSDYDAYYYSRARLAPLPVLRIKFDDPLETWIYVDVRRSAMVAQVHRLSRLERWLFNGLHSLDFAFWYDKRPLWDIGMILLSLGALITSGIGLVFGFRRLARAATRWSTASEGSGRAPERGAF